MTQAAVLDITIDKGADFNLCFQLFDDWNEPVSLSGSMITAKIRKSIADAAPTAVFTGQIIDGPNGIGNVYMPAVTTLTIPTDCDTVPRQRKLTQYLWDCNITYQDGSIQRIFEGACYASPEAST